MADSMQFYTPHTYQCTQHPLQSTILDASSVLGLPAKLQMRLVDSLQQYDADFRKLCVTGLLVKGLIMLTYSHILTLT